MNKNLVTYSFITFLIIFFFGFNFLFSLLGNILILLFLTPIFLILISFLGINSFKSKFKVCANCGATMLKDGESCLYCGSNINEIGKNKNYSEDAGNETIEIEAEEIN
tara:strand:+ start:131 stop:454 length:324 start_codon:yes stop_codon:yes gene_type:complete